MAVAYPGWSCAAHQGTVKVSQGYKRQMVILHLRLNLCHWGWRMRDRGQTSWGCTISGKHHSYLRFSKLSEFIRKQARIAWNQFTCTNTSRYNDTTEESTQLCRHSRSMGGSASSFYSRQINIKNRICLCHTCKYQHELVTSGSFKALTVKGDKNLSWLLASAWPVWNWVT